MKEHSRVYRSRFDLLEVLLIAVLVALAAWLLGSQRRPIVTESSPEAVALAGRFGPERNSQYEEEWVLRDFFGQRRGGFFVDVGANDYKAFSNTYYLETALGWSGIAVEPQTSFAAGYAAHRPSTRFLPFFVSDESNTEAKLYVSKNLLVSSADKAFNERFGTGAEAVTVPTITMNDLLDAQRVESIDFLSVDVELAEPQVLAGFDVERFRPALVCIEAHPEVRQQILDYFARHQYVVVGKYLRADTKNLYFMPVAGNPKRH